MIQKKNQSVYDEPRRASYRTKLNAISNCFPLFWFFLLYRYNHIFFSLTAITRITAKPPSLLPPSAGLVCFLFWVCTAISSLANQIIGAGIYILSTPFFTSLPFLIFSFFFAILSGPFSTECIPEMPTDGRW